MHNVFRILHAPFFIVPFFTECVDRATGYTFPADIFSKMQTIGMMIVIGPGARLYCNCSDDRANAHCLANRGYEAVAEAKGSKARSISTMSLRPV